MPNLYLVVSEELKNYGSYWIPPEYYCIAELVVAKNKSQAIYLAWKNDKDSFTNDMKDKPKFSCKLKQKNVNEPIGIIKDKYNNYWSKYWE